MELMKRLCLIMLLQKCITRADDRFYHGYALKNHVFGRFANMGAMQCVKKCLTSYSCMSINYSKRQLRCSLNDGNRFLYATDYITHSEYWYGDKQDFASVSRFAFLLLYILYKYIYKY